MADRTCLVCELCLKSNPQEVQLISEKCFHSEVHRLSKKVPVSWSADQRKLVPVNDPVPYIRPVPRLKLQANQRFILCKRGSLCTFGDNCTFAHSREEQEEWNSQIQQDTSTKIGSYITLSPPKQKDFKLQESDSLEWPTLNQLPRQHGGSQSQSQTTWARVAKSKVKVQPSRPIRGNPNPKPVHPSETQPQGRQGSHHTVMGSYGVPHSIHKTHDDWPIPTTQGSRKRTTSAGELKSSQLRSEDVFDTQMPPPVRGHPIATPQNRSLSESSKDQVQLGQSIVPTQDHVTVSTQSAQSIVQDEQWKSQPQPPSHIRAAPHMRQQVNSQSQLTQDKDRLRQVERERQAARLQASMQSQTTSHPHTRYTNQQQYYPEHGDRQTQHSQYGEDVLQHLPQQRDTHQHGHHTAAQHSNIGAQQVFEQGSHSYQDAQSLVDPRRSHTQSHPPAVPVAQTISDAFMDSPLSALLSPKDNRGQRLPQQVHSSTEISGWPSMGLSPPTSPPAHMQVKPPPMPYPQHPVHTQQQPPPYVPYPHSYQSQQAPTNRAPGVYSASNIPDHMERVPGMIPANRAPGRMDNASVPGMYPANRAPGRMDSTSVPGVYPARAPGHIDNASVPGVYPDRAPDHMERVPGMIPANRAPGRMDNASVPGMYPANRAPGRMDNASVPGVYPDRAPGRMDNASVPGVYPDRAPGRMDNASVPGVYPDRAPGRMERVPGMIPANRAPGRMDNASVPGVYPDRAPGHMDSTSVPGVYPDRAPGRMDSTNVPGVYPANRASGRMDNASVPGMIPANRASGRMDNASVPGVYPANRAPGRMDNANVPGVYPANRAPGRMDNASVPGVYPDRAPGRMDSTSVPGVYPDRAPGRMDSTSVPGVYPDRAPGRMDSWPVTNPGLPHRGHHVAQSFQSQPVSTSIASTSNIHNSTLGTSHFLPSPSPSNRGIAIRGPGFQETAEDVMHAPLSREHYKQKFLKLLTCEEKEHGKILHDKCSGTYTLILTQVGAKRPEWMRRDPDNPRHRRFGYLVGISGDQIAYATQASQGITLWSQGHEICRADILRENYNHIEERLYIAFDIHGDQKLQSGFPESRTRGQAKFEVSVKFELKHSYFINLQKCVKQLQQPMINKIMPSPTSFRAEPCPILLDLDRYKQHCSDDQLSALQAILSCPQNGPPNVIAGPFGTGKTRILAMASSCFFEEARIKRQPARVLVCTQQRESVDNFFEHYQNLMQVKEADQEIFILRDYGYKHHDVEMKNIYKTVKEFEYLSKRGFHGNLLIISTCMMVRDLFKSLGNLFFTHILMDEGAQMREPEAIAPLSLAHPDRTKIVIAGDQHQVGPAMLVLGDEPLKYGLATSLLERLYSSYKRLRRESYISTLVTNYRSHHDIVELPSALFYETPLIPPKDRKPPPLHPKYPYPLYFICSGLDEEICQVDANINKMEASILLDEVNKFARSWPIASWGPQDLSQTCLMCLPRPQLTVASQLVFEKRLSSKLKAMRRLPTYDMQGREFRALFLSTSEPTNSDGSTRNPTKSLCDRHVFNTAITRAQSLVVASGNPFLLLKTEKKMVERYGKKGKVWSNYLKRCFEHNSFIIASSLNLSRAQVESAITKLKALVFEQTKVEVEPEQSTDLLITEDFPALSPSPLANQHPPVDKNSVSAASKTLVTSQPPSPQYELGLPQSHINPALPGSFSPPLAVSSIENQGVFIIDPTQVQPYEAQMRGHTTSRVPSLHQAQSPLYQQPRDASSVYHMSELEQGQQQNLHTQQTGYPRPNRTFETIQEARDSHTGQNSQPLDLASVYVQQGSIPSFLANQGTPGLDPLQLYMQQQQRSPQVNHLVSDVSSNRLMETSAYQQGQLPSTQQSSQLDQPFPELLPDPFPELEPNTFPGVQPGHFSELQHFIQSDQAPGMQKSSQPDQFSIVQDPTTHVQSHAAQLSNLQQAGDVFSPVEAPLQLQELESVSHTEYRSGYAPQPLQSQSPPSLPVASPDINMPLNNLNVSMVRQEQEDRSRSSSHQWDGGEMRVSPVLSRQSHETFPQEQMPIVQSNRARQVVYSDDTDRKTPSPTLTDIQRERTLASLQGSDKNKETQELLPLSRLEKEYEVKDQLGKGGFGVVFQVRSRLDKFEYALKMIRLSEIQKQQDKVMREVHALARLDHPHIVRYHTSWKERAPEGWIKKRLWSVLQSSESLPSAIVPVTTASDSSPHTTPSSAHTPTTATEPSVGAYIAAPSIDSVVTFRDSNTGGFGELSQSIGGKDHSPSDGNVLRIGSEFRPPPRSDHTQQPPTCLFIQTELCERDTLRTWLSKHCEEKSRKKKDVLEFFQQLLKALVYIHNESFVHRDLKPSNIFFSRREGRLKIGDFGLVTTGVAIRPEGVDGSKYGADDSHSRGSIQAGTYLYMSPEQINGVKCDEKSDMFALGVIFFELHYYMKTDLERYKVLTTLRSALEFPPQFVERLPNEVTGIVRSLLATDPAKRPTAQELSKQNSLQKLDKKVRKSKREYIPVL